METSLNPLRWFRTFVLAFLAGIAFLAVAATPASADTVVSNPGASIIQVDVTLLTFLAGSLIPLLTAVVAKATASSTVKATANLVLSVVAGVVAAFVAGDGSLSGLEVATAAITTYLASGVSYNNFWKPTGIAGSVGDATADLGFGKPS